MCLALTACGSGATRPADTAAGTGGLAPDTAPVVRVGTETITGALYDHWMSIGAATVEPPPARAPLVYSPPSFDACVSALKATAPRSRVTQLRDRCRTIYEGINRRILNFLITGYWLRDAASQQHLTVTLPEVRTQFEKEKSANFNPATFRQLEQSSRQGVPDFLFAVETRMLSARLLARFTRAHPHRSEEANIRVFNASLRRSWVPRTNCTRGYVVPDCKQYHPRPSSSS
jgi:hypothetical protein